MGPSWRERRAQRRWEREALRRLEQLDWVDREQGLGALPLGTSAAGLDPPRRLRRGARRRTTGPVLPGLLVSGLLAAVVMFHDPGATGYRFRQLVEDLTGGGSGSYAFVMTTTDGDPVGWDPCRPIHYVVNPAGAPEDWEDVVRQGVDTLARASGFDFQYDGTSVDRSFHGRQVDPRDPPPVIVAWATSAELPDLEGATAGIGGSTPAQVGSRVRFITGEVVLDADAYRRMERTGDRTSQVLILTHELGHVLGLDHVDDSDELMYAKYRGQTGLGPGDLEGLRKLHELPCR